MSSWARRSQLQDTPGLGCISRSWMTHILTPTPLCHSVRTSQPTAMDGECLDSRANPSCHLEWGPWGQRDTRGFSTAGWPLSTWEKKDRWKRARDTRSEPGRHSPLSTWPYSWAIISYSRLSRKAGDPGDCRLGKGGKPFPPASRMLARALEATPEGCPKFVLGVYFSGPFPLQ